MWSYDKKENFHFDNGWDIHVNFENYEENGYMCYMFMGPTNCVFNILWEVGAEMKVSI